MKFDSELAMAVNATSESPEELIGSVWFIQLQGEASNP